MINSQIMGISSINEITDNFPNFQTGSHHMKRQDSSSSQKASFFYYNFEKKRHFSKI